MMSNNKDLKSPPKPAQAGTTTVNVSAVAPASPAKLATVSTAATPSPTINPKDQPNKINGSATTTGSSKVPLMSGSSTTAINAANSPSAPSATTATTATAAAVNSQTASNAKHRSDTQRATVEATSAPMEKKPKADRSLSPPPPPPIPHPSEEIFIGEVYDVLHQKPLQQPSDAEIKGRAATSLPPMPKGGWKWRPAVAQGRIDPKTLQFQFVDDAGGVARIELQEGNRNIQPANSMSPSHVMHHSYRTEDVLDVQDIFLSAKTGTQKRKWRKAQVIAIHPYFICIHYCGWSEFYDTWIHVLEEKERLAEFGSFTEKAEVEAANNEKNFRKLLFDEKLLNVVDVSPDGNCLFRAVALQVYGNDELHSEVRKSCCDYMVNNADRFSVFVTEGTFEEYIKRMREPKTWGDDPEIRAIEEMYDRPFEVYDATISDKRNPTEPIKIHFEGDLPSPDVCRKLNPIRVSYHGHNHYNAVVPIDFDKATVTPPEKGKEGGASLIRKYRLGRASSHAGELQHRISRSQTLMLAKDD